MQTIISLAKQNWMNLWNGKYTSDAQGATRFSGWKTDSVRRFNELCEKVLKDQQKNGDFDVNYYHAINAQANACGDESTDNIAVTVYDELDVALTEV